MQGQKLNGPLNLSRIPKQLVKKNTKGESVIYIDVLENKNGPDQYGNTHTITLYNKETRETIYLANLRPQAFGAQAQGQGNAPQQGGYAPQVGYAAPSPTYAPPQPAQGQSPQAQAIDEKDSDLPF